MNNMIDLCVVNIFNLEIMLFLWITMLRNFKWNRVELFQLIKDEKKLVNHDISNDENYRILIIPFLWVILLNPLYLPPSYTEPSE